MSKMGKKSKRRKLSKLLKSPHPVKMRIPIAPPTKVFKSKKRYDRKTNRVISKEDCD